MRIAIVVYREAAPFVRQDVQTLKEVHDVVLVSLLAHPLRFAFSVARSDVCLCWFADLHSALTIALNKILNRKTGVILGGYDVANLPEFHYGAFAYSPITRWSARYALENADIMFAVDPSLIDEAEENATVDRSRIEYLPTGYDHDFWKPDPTKHRQPIVTTAGRVDNGTFRLKGIDTFVRCATKFPNVRFVVAGTTARKTVRSLRASAGENVSFIGQLPQADLRTLFQSTSVFCQLSLHEGLPNALCEAMLCGCVPVGTNVGGIPRAIGDTGYCVPYGDVDASSEAIREALNSDTDVRAKARQRIVAIFGLRDRETRLKKYVEKLARSQPDEGKEQA